MSGETSEGRIQKLYQQLEEKDRSIAEAWQKAKDKEEEIHKYYK